MLGLGWYHRDQRQPQITHLNQYAIERGLIYNRTRQQRFTVVLRRDRKSLKPMVPMGSQMPFNTNVVLGLTFSGTVELIHGSCDRLAACVDNSKVQTDVGSRSPHMWGLNMGIGFNSHSHLGRKSWQLTGAMPKAYRARWNNHF